MNTTFVINGNDGQLGQISLLVNSLRDPAKGNFSGEILVISTALSDEVRNYYHSRGIKTFVSPLPEVTQTWSLRWSIAAFERLRLKANRLRQYLRQGTKGSLRRNMATQLLKLETQALARSGQKQPELGKELMTEFDLWHRKHLSKLVFFHYLEKVGTSADNLVVCDADMIFQRDAAGLLEKLSPGVLYYGDEVEPVLPPEQGGSPMFESNEWAIDHRYPYAKSLRIGADVREANVGFFCGKTPVVLECMKKWKELIFDKELEGLWVCDETAFWHEQDFFRLLRDMKVIPFENLGTDIIFHACLRGADVDKIKRLPSGEFIKKENGEKPMVVHFAGGVWKPYADIAKVYTGKPSLLVAEDILRTNKF